MIIEIKVPKWIHKEVKKELYYTIQSICNLLSDGKIKVTQK